MGISAVTLNPNTTKAVGGRKNQFQLVFWIVPFAFIYTFILAPIFALRGGDSGESINFSTAGGTTGNKLFWLVLSILTIYSILQSKKLEFRAIQVHVVLITIYIGLAILSAAWSDVPGISLRRSFQQLLVAFCLIVPFMMADDIDEIVIKICWVFACVALLNLLLAPLIGVPAFGYKGIYGQKNGMGQVAALCSYFSCYAISRSTGQKRYLFLISALMAVGLCLISRSKTSMVLLLIMPVGAMFVLWTIRFRDPLAKILVFLSVTLLILTTVVVSIYASVGLREISLFLFHDSTFTGRTMIWSFADYYINRSPWLGHGYGSFWGLGAATLALKEGFIAGLLQAHNGYIDVLLENGYVGLTLLTLLIIVLLKAILRLGKYNYQLSLLLLTTLLFVGLNNSMESSFFRSYVPLWIIFLFISGSTVFQKKDTVVNVNSQTKKQKIQASRK